MNAKSGISPTAYHARILSSASIKTSRLEYTSIAICIYLFPICLSLMICRHLLYNLYLLWQFSKTVARNVLRLHLKSSIGLLSLLDRHKHQILRILEAGTDLDTMGSLTFSRIKTLRCDSAVQWPEVAWPSRLWSHLIPNPLHTCSEADQEPGVKTLLQLQQSSGKQDMISTLADQNLI